MINTDKVILAELAAKIIKGYELTSNELRQFHVLMDKYPSIKTYLQNIIEEGAIVSPINLSKINVDTEWEEFTQILNSHNKPKSRIILSVYKRWISVAAAILLATIGLTIYFTITRENANDYIVADSIYGQKNDVLPGDEGAILEIVGEKEIVLDKVSSELTVAQGITASHKELRYELSSEISNPLHRLKVPIRSTYFVTLSDGSKVWINSDSQLEYQANFTKSERRVKLKGQAFFEVAKDSKRPFVVESNGIDIRAIGTEFDVNTYDRAKIQLTEGAIEVSRQGNKVNIKAGQQVVDNFSTLRVSNIKDLEETLAWRNGYFYCKDKTLKEILDDIERWYGVSVKLEANLGVKRYDGSISKSSTLAEVCNVLKDLTKYTFKIDGETLIISR